MHDHAVMDHGWQALCTEENKLAPSIVRHVHRVGDKLIRINMSPNERNVFGEFNDNQRLMRLLEENYRRASELVNTHLGNTEIKVPRVLSRHGDDVTVWEFINGVALDQLWDGLTVRQREGIKLQLRQFIARLWNISAPADFAVGSLCSTHELLCDNFHPHHPEYARLFWTNNGPYRTVEQYCSASQSLFYGYKPRFPVRVPIDSPEVRLYECSISEGLATARPVFDHLDWTPSNIIVHPNGDYVAGIIDWEYAAFIPDPADYFLRCVPKKRLEEEDWWTLFDGVSEIRAKR
jgi:hypothetical protein